MDNETINKRVHTEIMGLLAPCKDCGHVRPVASEICHNPCKNLMIRYSIPDYCTSLDLAATVEAVVIERAGYATYADEVYWQTQQSKETQGKSMTADAKTRMVACLAAWGRGGD